MTKRHFFPFRFLAIPVLLAGWTAAGEGANLVFEDDFAVHDEASGLPDPALGWQVTNHSPGIRGAAVVPDLENRFGRVSDNQVLRLFHDGSHVISQVMARDAFSHGASPVVTVGFDFWEPPGHPGGRVSLRVGKNRAFSADRISEVRFQQGSLNGVPGAYETARLHRIQIVFNNSLNDLVDYQGGATLASDHVDVWIDGVRVLANNRFLRGELPLGEALQSLTFDLAQFDAQTEMLIDRLRVWDGPFLDIPPQPQTYWKWVEETGLPVDGQDLGSDPAGDGMANLIKYGFGLFPLEPVRESWPSMIRVEEEGTVFPALAFVRSKTAAEAGFRLWRSSNLQDWEPVSEEGFSIVETVGEGWEVCHWRDDHPMDRDDRGFLRLEVVHRGGVELAPLTGLMMPSGGDAGPWINLLEKAGVAVQTLDEQSAPAFLQHGARLAVAAPGFPITPEVRAALHAFRQGGGNLILLNPAEWQGDTRVEEEIPVLDFQTAHDYSLQTPGSSQVNPEPVVITSFEEIPSTGEPGLRVWTQLIGDGDVLVGIPLGNRRSASRPVIRFHGRGDHGVDMLYLRIRDDFGRDWVAFVEAGMEWRQFEVSMADFLPTSPALVPGVDLLEPARAQTLWIGISRWILWPEMGGGFSVGRVTLGEAPGMDYHPTGAAVPWHVQYRRLGIETPRWLENPFLGSVRIEDPAVLQTSSPGDWETGLAETSGAPFWTVPPPPHERGREDTEIVQVLRRDDLWRRTLLTALDGGGRELGTVGELRFPHAGPWAGSSLALFGLESLDPTPGSPGTDLLIETARFLARTPKITGVTPVTGRMESGSGLFRCRVRISNPLSIPFAGRVAISASGLAGGMARVHLPAGESAEWEISLGEVPRSFPWLDFQWRVELFDLTGRRIERMEERVDVERTLAGRAAYLLSLQEGHADGRFSHHFFSDIYAARFLFGWARHLEETRGAEERQAPSMAGLTAADFREAAFRFTDHIVSSQREDGAFPMGYGEHRGVIFVADLGQVCLGMVQIASWLEEEDPRREAYLEVARRYFDFRQSFYIDEQKALELEAVFGPDPDRIRAGFYGIGLLTSDYFDGGQWPEIRREERGRWWVSPVSLGFLGGLVQLDGGMAYGEVAERDTRFFLDEGFGMTNVGYFHAEALLWMYYSLDDLDLRAEIEQRLTQFPPTGLTGEPHDHLDFQGRAMIRWLSLLYYQRYLEDSPRLRAALLKGLWAAGSAGSPHSLPGVAAMYPKTVYGPSIASLRYHAFASLFQLELLREGASLLRDRPFPVSPNHQVTP